MELPTTMEERRHRRRSRLLVVLLGAVTLAATGADELTVPEKRGKQIYLEGTSISGREIAALLGEDAGEVPAAALPCVNCHGYDGRGKPEGGVVPTSVTWRSLTKPYGSTRANGRRHPPYNESSVRAAIEAGVDPGGNPLHLAMPRYRMAPEDLADLVAYLKRVGTERDPGLTDTSITVGAILPPRKSMPAIAEAMKALLSAYFQEVNDRGGVNGRRIEMRFLEPDAERPATAAVADFLETEKIFALTAAFIMGAEEDIAPLMRDKEVPLVGPLALRPQVEFPLNRYVFYLLPGLASQARALADFAASKLGGETPRFAIVCSESGATREIPEAIDAQFEAGGRRAPTRIEYSEARFDAEGLVSQLKGRGVEGIFFLGRAAHLEALLRQADEARWAPYFFLPGTLVSQALLHGPPRFAERIFLSFPMLPSDPTQAGIEEYRALAEKHRLPAHSLAAQLSSLSAAKILVEGLSRAGRDASREKLLTELESLYQFDTELSPLVTYGPNRRVGALGAYVVSVDSKNEKLVPVSPWITPR